MTKARLIIPLIPLFLLFSCGEAFALIPGIYRGISSHKTLEISKRNLLGEYELFPKDDVVGEADVFLGCGFSRIYLEASLSLTDPLKYLSLSSLLKSSLSHFTISARIFLLDTKILEPYLFFSFNGNPYENDINIGGGPALRISILGSWQFDALLKFRYVYARDAQEDYPWSCSASIGVRYIF